MSETDRPRKYWSDLKLKLQKEGAGQLSEKIGQLKMLAEDGKMRMTDVANVAKVARESLEIETGKKVVSGKNAKNLLVEK